MSVGWAIWGVGSIARRVAPTLVAADESTLVAVCSRDAERGAAFASAHGARQVYTDPAAMLADPAVQAIYIGSPNALHAAQTIQALQAGKHVLVEKPMALSVADAEAMVAAAERHGVLLGVGFHLRHHPVHQALKERLTSGNAGEIVLGQAQFCSNAQMSPDRWQMNPAVAGAGSIMGLGVHMIDLLRYLTGQEVSQATALADGPSPGRPVEFMVLGNLAFDGGAYGQVICSRRLPNSLNNVTIYTTQERLVGEDTNSMQPSGRLVIGRGSEVITTNVPLRDAYQNQFAAFSRAVQGGPAFRANGLDGLRSVQITEALLTSAREGRTIRLG